MTLPAEAPHPIERDHRPYYKKSIAGRLRKFASDLEACREMYQVKEDCNHETLNELADEITDLIGESIGTHTKAISILHEARYGTS